MIELFHPGVASLTPSQPHTIGEIDHEISSLSILLSFDESRRASSIDESKPYVTNQYQLEHYGLYPIAGKYSGWQ